MARHPLFIAIVCVLVASLVPVGLIARQNWQGICRQSGRIVPDEQRIAAAVKRVIGKIDVAKRQAESLRRSGAVEDYSEIPQYYRSASEFIDNTVRCCRILSSQNEIKSVLWQPSVWGRLTGAQSSVVEIKFEGPVFSANDKPVVGQKTTYIMLGNCAEVYDFL